MIPDKWTDWNNVNDSWTDEYVSLFCLVKPGHVTYKLNALL